jgi:hypothetical protein
VAPIYCSGWFDGPADMLQASCQLEPLALAAFESYYAEPRHVQVKQTTLKVTSQWSANANVLSGRVQLELARFEAGMISVRDRPIANLKKFDADPVETRLHGEIAVAGPLDQPRQWRAIFVPGDEIVQQQIQRLRNRGVEAITLPFWLGSLPMSLASASPTAMADVGKSSKAVQEALEILAMPSPVDEAGNGQAGGENVDEPREIPL